MESSPAQMLDSAEIERALGVLVETGQTFEFRILEAQRAGSQHPVTITGYFDNRALASGKAVNLPLIPFRTEVQKTEQKGSRPQELSVAS